MLKEKPGAGGGMTGACGPRPSGAAVATFMPARVLRRCLAPLRDARLEPNHLISVGSNPPNLFIPQGALRTPCGMNGGEGGIRTHGTRKGTLDFESSPFGQLRHLSGAR